MQEEFRIVPDRRDESLRPAASLSIDLADGIVIGLLHVSDAVLPELTVGSESALELGGEQLLISGVVGTVVDEWKDVLLTIEHAAWDGFGL